MAQLLKFNHESLNEKKTFKDKNGKEHTIDVYIPSEQLVEAVHLAYHLWQRPLLLMGEPGCGKTRLAEAVAYAIHGEKMYEHFFRWDIKSTTKAKEGIYQYDALKRLYHVNLSTHIGLKEDQNIEDIGNYITPGILNLAFSKPQNGDMPNILLIDEIDKADKDFPNDLLLEIEKREFAIPELGDSAKVEAKSKVLIFITSNREKELPSAFLRRCLFYYIEFPETDALIDIVSRHKGLKKENKLVNDAIKAFENLREGIGDYEKKPSTSELLDWFEILNYYNNLKIKNQGNFSSLTKEEQKLIKQLELLEKDKIPFVPILLKTYQSFINASEIE